MPLVLLSLSVLLALCQHQIDRLGSPRWRDREAAEAFLRPFTRLCLPQLEDAERGDRKELARRASRLVDHHYACCADWHSRRVGTLPPIGLMGELAFGRDWDDSWSVWGPMEEYTRQAYESLGRPLPSSLAWELVGDGRYCWTLRDADDVQREATRLLVRGFIARRVDYRPLLNEMERAARAK